MTLKNIIESFESIYFKDFKRTVLVEDLADLAEKWLQKLIDRDSRQGIQAKSIGLSDEMARRYKRLR